MSAPRMFAARPYLLHPSTPAGYAELLLRHRIDRARGHTGDRGASVVEWVVIAAIVVTLTLGIGVVLATALRGKAAEVGTQIDGSGGGL